MRTPEKANPMPKPGREAEEMHPGGIQYERARPQGAADELDRRSANHPPKFLHRLPLSPISSNRFALHFSKERRGRVRRSLTTTLGAFLFQLVLLASPAISRADCSLTSLGVLPLSDSMLETYKSEPGGLYPGGSSTPPAEHEARGVEIGNAIRPLNGNGEVDLESGQFVLVTFGMSNTASQTEVFIDLADNDASINPQVVIIKGAQGGYAANDWTQPTQVTWDRVDQRLAGAGLTPAQVQVGWVKQGLPYPQEIGEFPVHASALQDALEQFARTALIRYPNLKLLYVSSRTRSYEYGNGLNPEPYAFESGFATRWMIENQINGSEDLNFDPEAGAVVAPYLLWGPYLWADGLDERSDRFTWECADVRSDDFTHPSNSGQTKVANQLLAFFKTHPTAEPWFLRSSTLGQPPTCAATADWSSGPAPLTVGFQANASDDGQIVEYAWTFSDGTFSFDQNPLKTFHAEDQYDAHLTVTDDDGNPAACTKTIAVPEPSTEHSVYAALLMFSFLHLKAWRPGATIRGHGSRSVPTRSSNNPQTGRSGIHPVPEENTTREPTTDHEGIVPRMDPDRPSLLSKGSSDRFISDPVVFR